MAVTAGLDERIRELVGQHRDELEQLVDAAVERELAALVEQRLANGNGNGNGFPTDPVDNPGQPQAKLCSGPCGRLLPADRFERHRSRCRDCRRQDALHARERRARVEPPAEPAPEPRPAIDPADLVARVRRNSTVAPNLVGWLVDERLAEQTPDGLVATARTLELAGAIDA